MRPVRQGNVADASFCAPLGADPSKNALVARAEVLRHQWCQAAPKTGALLFGLVHPEHVSRTHAALASLDAVILEAQNAGTLESPATNARIEAELRNADRALNSYKSALCSMGDYVGSTLGLAASVSQTAAGTDTVLSSILSATVAQLAGKTAVVGLQTPRRLFHDAVVGAFIGLGMHVGKRGSAYATKLMKLDRTGNARGVARFALHAVGMLSGLLVGVGIAVRVAPFPGADCDEIFKTPAKA